MQAEIVNIGEKQFGDLAEGDWFVIDGEAVRFVSWNDWNRYTDTVEAECRRNGIPQTHRACKTHPVKLLRVMLG